MVVAVDSFKGSASAAEAGRALAAGWSATRPQDEVRLVPMADGGEGTIEAFAAVHPSAARRRSRVLGPLDAQVDTEWLLLEDGTAVLELARSSGLPLADGRAPLDTHTYGLGQTIAAALAAGARRLVIGLGGSSSTDGGTGALAALGARWLDAAGRAVPLGNRGLADLARAELAGLPERPAGGVLLLTDVTNPLLGPSGAAAVFGPQKGAGAAQVAVLEANLARLADVVGAAPDCVGCGAAGGTTYGLRLWGATVAAGSESVAELLGLPAALDGCDVVITGEGRYDAQSMAGKVPVHVARLAGERGVACLLAAGRVEGPTAGLFAGAVSLAGLAGDPDAAMRRPLEQLVRAGRVLAASAGRYRPAPLRDC